MTSLHTLRTVELGSYGAVELIKELRKPKQIRKLVLYNFFKEDGSILSSSISEMQLLEKLHIVANIEESYIIDLHLNSLQTKFKNLHYLGS